MIIRFLTLFLIFVSHVFAGLITIPLEDRDYKFAPASDLVFQSKRISEIEAMELEKKGIDLSKLDPYESDLFRLVQKPNNPRLHNIREVTFNSFLQSPTEFFRFASKNGKQGFTVTASLFNHETMIRADLLRKIGYNAPEVFSQTDLKVQFDSISQMTLFIEKLVESTLLSQKRWIIEENKDQLYLKMRGLILEPADTTSVPVYWPIMEETRQRKRRIFRSLLYLYSLTDFNMPINEISWSLAKIFNNELILSHHYSEEFSSVTIADLKWIHRRIVSVPENQLCSGIKKGNYPEDIADLLCEKLKSRINSFGKALGLSSPFKVITNIGSGQVRDGKLLSGDYPNYVPVFWIEDVESPFRFSEVFKFFRTQMTYDTISSLLTSAEKKYLPGISTDEAYESIITKIKDFGKKNGTVPVKVWSAPTANGSVGGSRSIVFGQYDGNDAPIQLVDTLNMRLQVGLFNFLSIPGAPALPTATLNAQVVRTWKHIKAMPDLGTASSQKIKQLLIPKLYKTLASVLESDPQCSLQENAWVTEEIVSGVGIWMIYYNKGNESAKESAAKLREELIAKGIPKNKIILQPVLKDELCLKEITEKRNKSIEEFLKSFAADETLTLTDSFETIAGAGVKVSDAIVNGLNLQAGFDTGRAIMRTYILRKTENGIEITIQNQKDLSSRFYQEIKFFISLLSNSTSWTNGDLFAKVYRVNFEGVDDEQKKIAINVLREIFLRSSYGLLADNYNPIDMDHDMRVKINTFKFFWRKSERVKMNHEVSVTVPNRDTRREIPQEEIVDEWTIPVQPASNLPKEERTKTLFSTMVLKRVGSNYHSFLNQILNDQYSWISTGPQEKDPGQSIKGKSFHNYIVTEGDLTPKSEFNPVTKIEYGHIGWSVTGDKIDKFLKEHEEYLSTLENEFTLDRSIFNQTDSLRSYNIRTTIILYPGATNKILQSLLIMDELESISLLKKLYGPKEWEVYCRAAEESQDQLSLFESLKKKGKYYCVPYELIEVLRMRKSGVAIKRQDLGVQINTIVQILMNNLPRRNFLSWVGKENFFGNSFISGFRNGDSLGYVLYGSDTVGTYNKDLATGIFDQVASLLGVRPYNLKGMVYTPSM